jgi:hypothetical protein
MTQNREPADDLARAWLERPAMTDHLLGALADARQDAGREEMIAHMLDAVAEAEKPGAVVEFER